MEFFERKARRRERQEQEKKCDFSQLIKLPLCEGHLRHISWVGAIAASKELLEIIDSNNRIISKIKNLDIDAGSRKILSLFENVVVPPEFNFKKVKTGYRAPIAARIPLIGAGKMDKWRNTMIRELELSWLLIKKEKEGCLISLIKEAPEHSLVKIYQSYTQNKIRFINMNFPEMKIQEIICHENDIVIRVKKVVGYETYTKEIIETDTTRDSGEPGDWFTRRQVEDEMKVYANYTYHFDDHFDLKSSEKGVVHPAHRVHFPRGSPTKCGEYPISIPDVRYYAEKYCEAPSLEISVGEKYIDSIE